MAELKTLEELGMQNPIFRPSTYTVRLASKAAPRWVRRIEAMDPGSSASQYLLGVSGGALGWQDSDYRDHGITELDAWGHVVITVRATDEHDADRAVRKILVRALADEARPSKTA
jgi:hypothetical protein